MRKAGNFFLFTVAVSLLLPSSRVVAEEGGSFWERLAVWGTLTMYSADPTDKCAIPPGDVFRKAPCSAPKVYVAQEHGLQGGPITGTPGLYGRTNKGAVEYTWGGNRRMVAVIRGEADRGQDAIEICRQNGEELPRYLSADSRVLEDISSTFRYEETNYDTLQYYWRSDDGTVPASVFINGTMLWTLDQPDPALSEQRAYVQEMEINRPQQRSYSQGTRHAGSMKIKVICISGSLESSPPPPVEVSREKPIPPTGLPPELDRFNTP